MTTFETTAIATENTTVETPAVETKKARKPRTVAPKLTFADAIVNLESGLLSGFTAVYGNKKAKHKVTFLSADGENMAFAAPDAGKALSKQDYNAIKTTISVVSAAGFDVDVATF